MIELFYANTPNGRKISIMLEEIKYPYKITPVDIFNGEQFDSKFRSISPFSKIPVMTDHENNISIFEKGLIFLKSSLNWSPLDKSIFLTAYSKPISSSIMLIFFPLGVSA